MAKLFDLTTQTERPIARPAGPARGIRSSAPGAPGQGLEVLGQSLERGADEVFRAQQIEEDRVNTLRAEEAATQLRQRRLELTLGPDGFQNLKGAAAVTRPIYKEWGKKLEDATGTLSATLSNDTQQTRFRARADLVRLQYDEDILRHLAREGDVYAKEVYDGRMSTARQTATAKWDSPLDVASELANVKDAVEARAERYSWTPEYRAAVLSEERSKIHAAVITQAIASGNNTYAQDWYQKNRADIDVGTARVLERTVADGVQKDLSSTYRSEFLAGRDDVKALTELGRRISADKVLELDRQNALLGPIHSRIDILEHQQEMKRDRTLKTLQRGIDGLNARTRAGFEPGVDEFAPYLDAAKGTELEPEVRGALQLAAATRGFRLSTPGEQERTLQALESQERSRPGSIDHKLLADLRQIHDAQQRLIQDSPVAFAYRQGLDSPVRVDWATLDAQGEQIAARIATARGMQTHYGAQLKPLLPEEVSEIKARLDRAGPEDRMQWFGKLRAESGGDSRNYSAIMAQLAPDEPVLALVGEHAGKGRTDAARIILQGQELLRPGRKTDGSPDQGKLWPMPPDTEMRKRFQDFGGDAFASQGKYRNMAYQATLAAYAKLSEDKGDDRQTLDTERFRRAFDIVTGGVDDYRGRHVFLPYGMAPGDFRRGLNERIEDVARSGRLAPGMTEGRLRDMPIESIGDGRYAFPVGDGYLADKTGRPIVVNFNLEPEERGDTRFRGTMQGAPQRQVPPWERPKPRLENPDGSFSTERTITIEADGRHYLVPTIVGGTQRTEDEAVRLWRAGSNQAVGEFGTAAEADRAAKARSDEIGRRGR